jgi:hypothetical protein
LPFLFAGWVARDAAVLEVVGPALLAACADGIGRLPAIARSEAIRLALPEARVFQYLSDIMHYRTDAADAAGLAEFTRRTRGLGLV